MIKYKGLLLSLLLVAASSLKAANLNFNESNSSINFEIDHMVFMTANGSFKEFSGTINNIDSSLVSSVISFSVNIASIDTDDEQRDEHLRTKDFFDVEKYPNATFESSLIESIGEKKYKVAGELTIHGITKLVEFIVVEEKSESGKINYHMKLELNRLKFGVGESSIMMSDNVKLKVKLSAI